MDTSTINNNNIQIKRIGRKPLPEEKRRVQFGTRISPLTLHWLEATAKEKDKHFGRIIDDLVECARSEN